MKIAHKVIILLLGALIVISCSEREKVPIPALKTRMPDSVLENATVVMTSSGIKQAIIYADTFFIFEKEDSVTAQNVKVDFFDEKGTYQSTLTAKTGLVRQKEKSFSVWGDVVAKNDTSRLDTQSLYWDSARNLITTNDFVRFQRGRDILTGYGLEADSKLQNVRILRDVKGSIHDIPKSEKELDSLESPNSKEIAP